MIEYIFFSTELRDRFVTFVRTHGLDCEVSDDPLGMVVAIPEDIPEALSDQIEDYYGSLEDEQEDMSAAEGDLHRLAGFGFKLPNGEARLLPIEPDLANRLMAHFSLEEIQSLLNDVARYTLEPADPHLCHILAERKAIHDT
jgi:hypothetical protein